jgi:hypothetical protein
MESEAGTTAIVIFSIVTFLISLSILFEKVREKVDDKVSATFKPVVETFFGINILRNHNQQTRKKLLT